MGTHWGARAEQVFTVNALTLGYSREIGRVGGLDALVGGALTFHAAPSELRSVYGDLPVGVHVFLRLRPGRMRHQQRGHEAHAPGRHR